MARLIILIAVVTLLWLLWRSIKTTPREKQNSLYWKIGLSLLALLLVILAATGRIHWVGAMIGAMIPLLRRSLPLLIRFFPLLRQYFGQRGRFQQQRQQQPPAASNAMTLENAYATLGLKPGASKQEIIEAHRKMMQKNHPDRGGSDYLAAQINEAKDLLLKALGD